MKLSNRITLLVSIVLTVVILAVSLSLLLFAKNTILSLSVEQVQRKQQTLRTSFSEMANYYAANSDSDAVHASLVRYCFTRFADQTSVLMRNGEAVVSGVTVDPSVYVQQSDDYGEAEPVAVTVQGRRLLIAGNSTSVGGKSYDVYVVEDVSDVYNRISRMTWIFAGVSIAAIALGAVVVMLLVRRSTKPITALSETAREIADGAYEKRVKVRTKDEIGTLGEDFNRMADAVETKISELSERNERQRLFIGGVTHEFKTPMTGLILHAGLLRRANLSEDERDASLAHIEAQTQWLERLTQNLLKLTTSDEKIELERVAIPELLDAVKEGVEAKLNERGAALCVQCETDTLVLNEFIDPWQYEYVTVVVGGDGEILCAEWFGSLRVTDVISEAASLLPYDEILPVFEQQMNRRFAEAGANTTVTVSDVQLGLFRIREKNDPYSGLLIPAWFFTGEAEYPGSKTSIYGPGYPLCVINAVDGTIIDPEMGY